MDSTIDLIDGRRASGAEQSVHGESSVRRIAHEALSIFLSFSLSLSLCLSPTLCLSIPFSRALSLSFSLSLLCSVSFAVARFTVCVCVCVCRACSTVCSRLFHEREAFAGKPSRAITRDKYASARDSRSDSSRLKFRCRDV